jgi:hypothetical protein
VRLTHCFVRSLAYRHHLQRRGVLHDALEGVAVHLLNGAQRLDCGGQYRDVAPTVHYEWGTATVLSANSSIGWAKPTGLIEAFSAMRRLSFSLVAGGRSV